MNKPALNLFKTGLLAGMVLVCTSSLKEANAVTTSETGKIFHANETNPGAEVDLKSILSNNVTTLLFIHSPHCGPCKVLAPKIRKLAHRKTDLKIVDTNLDKPSDPGIGWESAAAKQFDVHSVPAFMIFDRNGKLLSRGEAAQQQVDTWLVETKIVKK